MNNFDENSIQIFQRLNATSSLLILLVITDSRWAALITALFSYVTDLLKIFNIN